MLTRSRNYTHPQVTTIAGTGIAGSADGGAATATFNHPTGVAVDGNGVAIVTSYTACALRQIENISFGGAAEGVGNADDVLVRVTTLIKGATQPAPVLPAASSGPKSIAKISSGAGFLDPSASADAATRGAGADWGARRMSIGAGGSVAAWPLHRLPSRRGSRLHSPYDVMIGPGGCVYVTDRGKHALVCLSGTGLAEPTIGLEIPPEVAGSALAVVSKDPGNAAGVREGRTPPNIQRINDVVAREVHQAQSSDEDVPELHLLAESHVVRAQAQVQVVVRTPTTAAEDGIQQQEQQEGEQARNPGHQNEDDRKQQVSNDEVWVSYDARTFADSAIVAGARSSAVDDRQIDYDGVAAAKSQASPLAVPSATSAATSVSNFEPLASITSRTLAEDSAYSESEGTVAQSEVVANAHKAEHDAKSVQPTANAACADTNAKTNAKSTTSSPISSSSGLPFSRQSFSKEQTPLPNITATSIDATSTAGYAALGASRISGDGSGGGQQWRRW